MKKILTILLLLLTTLAVYAYDFEYGGIYYNVTSNVNKTVEATYLDKYNETTSYTGDLIIPEKVTCSDTIYTVTSIGNLAFYSCSSLKSIELPSSVSEIGKNAFWACESLITVTSLSPEPPTLGSSVFNYCPIETVYVPTEAVEAYQTADGWKEFKKLF
jgi:hypothetical protein